MARAADTALAEQFPEMRFVTAVLAELDLDSGRLSYLNAGHPHPLLFRDGRLVKTLSGGRRRPLGVPEVTGSPPSKSCGRATGCCCSPTA